MKFYRLIWQEKSSRRIILLMILHWDKSSHSLHLLQTDAVKSLKKNLGNIYWLMTRRVTTIEDAAVLENPLPSSQSNRKRRIHLTSSVSVSSHIVTSCSFCSCCSLFYHFLWPPLWYSIANTTLTKHLSVIPRCHLVTLDTQVVNAKSLHWISKRSQCSAHMVQSLTLKILELTQAVLKRETYAPITMTTKFAQTWWARTSRTKLRSKSKVNQRTISATHSSTPMSSLTTMTYKRTSNNAKMKVLTFTFNTLAKCQ